MSMLNTKSNRLNGLKQYYKHYNNNTRMSSTKKRKRCHYTKTEAIEN